MQHNDKGSTLSSCRNDEEVTAIITLKVDNRDADGVCECVSLLEPVADVFLVTGDTDIVIKAKFLNYTQLKRFLVEELSIVRGVKDTKTLMAVATFKEKGVVRPAL